MSIGFKSVSVFGNRIKRKLPLAVGKIFDIKLFCKLFPGLSASVIKLYLLCDAGYAAVGCSIDIPFDVCIFVSLDLSLELYLILVRRSGTEGRYADTAVPFQDVEVEILACFYRPATCRRILDIKIAHAGFLFYFGIILILTEGLAGGLDGECRSITVIEKNYFDILSTVKLELLLFCSACSERKGHDRNCKHKQQSRKTAQCFFK